MYKESNVVELFQERPPIANDEDFITLLEQGDDYIYYVRNYAASQEFIILSAGMIERLPQELRPLTPVFLRTNFHAIRQFKHDIQEYVLISSQFNHFNYLFGCSINDFFNTL